MKNPIVSGLNIPIHSIFCIGKNYMAHAVEMNSVPPKEPMIFLKPLSAITYNNSPVLLPSKSNNVHHEVELVLAIGKSGKNITKENAYAHIAGFGIGIDFTARDLQKIAKQNGTPWSVAKGFDGFAPISEFQKFSSEIDFTSMEISLSVNDEIRQHGLVSDLIFDIPTLVSYLSTIFTLEEGDLIFTGTPEGVSAVKPGDTLTANIKHYQPSLTVTIQ